MRRRVYRGRAAAIERRRTDDGDGRSGPLFVRDADACNGGLRALRGLQIEDSPAAYNSGSHKTRSELTGVLPGYRKRVMAGCVALAALAVPSAAHAQYTAPPPAPGFHYIFDGTATGSDASFDKWKFASGTLAQSATQGQATLDAAEGTIRVGASPFGSYWYTPRPFGDTVFRIQYQIENTPTATPNGGIMVRAPYFAYTGADTNAVLAQKPTGFNYDVCGGALAFCNRTTPGASTSYNWAGKRAWRLERVETPATT